MSNFHKTRHIGAKKHGEEPTKNGTTLTAVALQDQIMRSMGGLSLSDPLGRNRRAPAHKPVKKKTVTSKLDTGKGQGTQKAVKTTKPGENEYVLDSKPAPLTLAQKLGLVEAPAQLLDEDEWAEVKQKSNARDDSKEPCVICKEDFGCSEQVLLSCTHVFHRHCLEAFEKFTGKKTCPMCRKEQYQARVIHEGAKEHRQKCAILIQATWRGYVVRAWYRKLRLTVPPNDPGLRQKFYENKLQDITDRMVRSLDYDVNRFLSDIDQSLEASRDVFRNFDNSLRVISVGEWEEIQLKAVVRGETDCPICLTSLEEQGLVSKLAGADHTSVSDTKSSKRKVPNQKSKSKAQEEASEQRRKRLLLSCSHVFHQTCLEAFEEFAVGDKKYICPVCRSNYQKKIL